MVEEAGLAACKRRTTLGCSRRASVGAVGLHGGGCVGSVCCNGEDLARCFWPWQLAGEVVEVALGGVLPLLEEDGCSALTLSS
jgi:hypothetical protein